MPLLKRVAFAFALSFGACPMAATVAQDQRPPAAPATAPAQDLLKAEQLDQLLAPIALYPDNLLAEVLMASTYPLEVVEASRWVNENKDLKADQLKTALDGQSWDNSVKSLTATPSVLDMMSTKLSWTQKLGDAVLAQQPDVMDSVQRLRTRAQASNKLQSTKEQKVSVKTEQNKQVIVIEPAQPNTLYVPYYNPQVVYGAWPYASYPPYYFPPAPGYYAGAALATGLAFGAGVAMGAWASGGYWGGNVNWGGNNINVNRQVNINNQMVNRSGNWQHDPSHRQGVRYNNANVANQFGKGNAAHAGAQNRMDFRGRSGQQVLKPGGGAGGAGAGVANRGGAGAGAADRGGQRASAGGGAGQRQNAGNRGGGGQAQSRAGRSGGRESAMNVGGGGRNAMAQSARGHASLGASGGGLRAGGGGVRAGGGGGGGMRAGGGGGGRGGRRSDIRLKHDVVFLGRLDNGLGFYRFSYNGSDRTYVGVMAQEVQMIAPQAVTPGADGYLRVHYEMLGLKFQTYDQWIRSGAGVPTTTKTH